MFLSDPLLQKYWLEKSKIKLMIGVQIVNVFDSHYIKNQIYTHLYSKWLIEKNSVT